MRQSDAKQVRSIALLFSVTYMVSYITRINYGSVISEMEARTGFARSLLAMALTGSFITYGLGQIVSGVLGDRFSPKKLVAAGLLITVSMNSLIPVCASPWQMLVVWSVNGFAQSLMWPPLVRLMSGLLSPEDYDRVVVRVSWGSSIGTVLVYLLAPVAITLAGWQGVFLGCAACGAVMIPIWLRFCQDVPAEQKTSRKEKTPSANAGLLSPLVLGIMAAIMLQGTLRDGVTTWMPSYVAETYGLSNRVAILTGVVMPLFSIGCFQLTTALYHKKFTNPMACAGILFGFGALSAAGLYAISGTGPAVSVLLSALLTGAMHGVNLLLVCMVPQFFRRYGSVATVSGVLNCCTYVGSAASSYGIALLSERLGWHATIAIWALIAAAGGLICLACIGPWRKRFC